MLAPGLVSRDQRVFEVEKRLNERDSRDAELAELKRAEQKDCELRGFVEMVKACELPTEAVLSAASMVNSSVKSFILPVAHLRRLRDLILDGAVLREFHPKLSRARPS